jgi:hypothetical protein
VNVIALMKIVTEGSKITSEDIKDEVPDTIYNGSHGDWGI